MFLLSQLLPPISDGRFVLRREDDGPVSELAGDSRQVRPGTLFVCIAGKKFDGHQHAAEAVKRGAVAIVAEDASRLGPLVKPVPVLVVRDSRRALALLASEFYRQPSTRLKLVGVTGTNGKTTTTYLLASIFRAAGERAAIIGTLGATTDTGNIPLPNTTPDALVLQPLLDRFVHEGYGAVAMEVSSHALAMSRVAGCAFAATIFTNLSRDHLDFHPDLESYFQTKARLFTHHTNASGKPGGAAINVDGAHGRRLVEMCSGPVISFGISHPADVRAEELSFSPAGVGFQLRTRQWCQRVALKLTGRFNVENALAASAAAELMGFSPEAICAGLEAVESVPGRMEMIQEGQNFIVAVDYAHTPDGLEKALHTAREITRGRLIVLFGCGGDRDRGKRPQMGALAGALADICVLTSDNPRSESPAAILQEIHQGVRQRAGCHVEMDRRRAIKLAFDLASQDDFVLLAGKGHETGQIIGSCTTPFDDREVARELLRQRQRAMADKSA